MDFKNLVNNSIGAKLEQKESNDYFPVRNNNPYKSIDKLESEIKIA